MVDRRRRLGILSLICAAAVPLAVAATAFACANLTSLKLNRVNATPGSEVVAYGANYNARAGMSPVAFRFNSRTGRVLWEGRPTSRGKVRGTFKVPSGVRPGHYVIVSTQSTPAGEPVAGTPGRAPLRVVGSSSSSGTVAGAPAPRSGGPAASQVVPIGVPAALGLGLLSLGLAAYGVALVTGGRRRRIGLSHS